MPHEKCRLGVILLGLYIGAAVPTHAQAPAAKKTPNAPRALPGTMQIEPPRRMQGKKFAWDHEIQVALPPSYGQGDKRYPVLWVTDGHGNFSIAVQTTRFVGTHVPEMIIVGVGAPPEAVGEFQTRRAYEFGAVDDWARTNAPGREVYLQAADALDQATLKAGMGKVEKSGGAQDFLSFLVDEVRPALARQYRMADTHVIYGHSGGGTFCTYALLARPEAFAKYLCSSAALFGGDSHLFELESKYAATHSDLKADVFFDAGEAEILQPTIAGLGVVSSTVRMAEVLSERKYPSLRLSMRIFPSDDHGSVVPVGLYWGLRTVWGATPEAGR